jgi:hypothetical protein
VAHLEHGGNVGHRHVFAVGGTDGLIPLLAQLSDSGLQLALAFYISLGEGFEARLSFGRFSFRSSDLKIVGVIPAMRLADTGRLV